MKHANMTGRRNFPEESQVNGMLTGFSHKDPPDAERHRWPKRPGLLLAAALTVVALCALLLVRPARADAPQSQPATRPAASLEQTRLMLDKWIETQQIIAKERKDWQQGKEILQGRIELISKEISTLEEKIQQAQASVAEAQKKRDELVAQNKELKEVAFRLTAAVTGMEHNVVGLYKMLPEPIQTKLEPLRGRIPEDPEKTRAAVAERYQNVLGILNEVNKANNEITVNYEVHTLASGKPAEVQAIYVGLTQAYYVSAAGEAGISHPTAEGWKWEPRNSIARELQTVLEILQGKQSAAFVPLPVKLK